MITWTVLGSGTHVASATRGSPGHLVSVDGTRLLADCGAGTFHGLARAGVAADEIEGCLITHVHPDHVTDLAPLLFRIRNIVKERGEAKVLPLYGPPGFNAFVDGLRRLHAPFLETPDLTIEVHEGELGSAEFPTAQVRFEPVPHGIGAIAFSIGTAEGATDRSRVVYTGDTGRSAALVRFARGASLLVIEASYPNDDDPGPFHLTPAGAAAIATEAEIPAMLLVHLNPACDAVDLVEQCGEDYKGRVLVAEDGKSIHVRDGEVGA